MRRIRSSSVTGFATVGKERESIFGVEIQLYPWQSIDVPDKVAELLSKRTGGKLEYGGDASWPQPYQLRVCLPCP